MKKSAPRLSLSSCPTSSRLSPIGFLPLGLAKKSSLAALTFGLSVGLSTAAFAAPVDRPPPPADMEFEPIEDNPFFVQDKNDPRILLKKSTFDDVGITRAYVERMARPPIPKATLDAIDVARPDLAFQAPIPVNPTPLALPNAATVFNGNIMVIEGDQRTTVQTEDGLGYNHNSGIQYILNEVFTKAGDNFDFVTVFTSFSDNGVAAYYMPLRQYTTGLGNCDFNSGETFGCVFDSFSQDQQSDSGVRLQGFVFMNSLSYWAAWDRQMDGVTHPVSSEDHSLYPVMGQEIAHRWGSGLRFKDPRTSIISTKLLGRDKSHWAGWVDSDASVMDGVDWVEQDDGTFLAVNDMFRFSTLDLYTMGALPQQAARPFFFIDDARFIANQFVGNQPVPAELTTYLPSIEYLTERGVDLEATGERVDLTIQNIIEAEGQRCPDPDHTQKTFKQLFVLVTSPGQSAAQVSGIVADLEVAKTVWEGWWLKNTERRLSLCAHPDAWECPLAEAELGNWSIDDDNGDAIIDPGESFELTIDVKANNEDVKGARVLVELFGSGAESATLSETEYSVGDIATGRSTKVRIPMDLVADYPCGQSMVAIVTLTSDNAADIIEHYRIFPGYALLSETTFDDETGVDFFVDDEESDQTDRGALEKNEVFLTCFMTPNTPERDATPNGTSAFITGEKDDLKGNSSLYSDSFDLSSALAPEVRFEYWLDGEGSLEVSVSDDASTYKALNTYDSAYHGWVSGRLDLVAAYPDGLPEKIWVRYLFDGDGVEGGIDDIRLLDAAGQCAPPPSTLDDCSCDQSPDAKTPWSMSLLSLLGLFLWRRRRG
ncbi:MAG: hypothetical protein GY822_19650 [Deltaproteobacteria bacterium]|nr:hypothetical protein [Deltaproteobacteria bacterium]